MKSKYLPVYQALFESATECLLVVDTQGTILLSNPRVTELFGYRENELLGEKIEVLLPDRIKGHHVNLRDNYIEHPTRRSMGVGRDLAGRRKDGSEFPVEVSLNSFDLEGKKMVMALVTDITMRKQAEQELAHLNRELETRVRKRTIQLRNSQRLYSIIARNFPNGSINVFDRDLNYVFVEGKELYKLGLTSERLVGTHYLSHLDPEIRDDIRDHLMQVFEGQNSTFEVSFKGNQYEMNAVALPDEDGKIDQILVVEHNISRQKQAQAEIHRALEKERELNELKSRFVSMASHEFRTPLSTILTSTSLLARYDQPEHSAKREKHLARIKTSVINLTGILNDFLSLDKLEAGAISCQPTEFDLKHLFAEVAEEMSVILKPGQELHSGFEGDTIVRLDPKLLKNVLINLVSNAIKYSPEGGRIELLGRRGQGKIHLEVADQGIGIPAEDQGHLFDRFFRAANATNIQGTGLGLNIVRKYLHLMQGEISFESKPGQGTVFFVELPSNLSYETDTPD